jgi:hypothetical protein
MTIIVMIVAFVIKESRKMGLAEHRPVHLLGKDLHRFGSQQ